MAVYIQVKALLRAKFGFLIIPAILEYIHISVSISLLC